jgi:hypothetical protein
VVRDRGAREGDQEQHDAGEHAAERDDLGHDGTTAFAAGSTMREGATELLFQREEDAGREGEGGEPERGDRCELVVASQRPRADPEERVGGDTSDEEAQPDGECALRERHAPRGLVIGGGHEDREAIPAPAHRGGTDAGATRPTAG